MTILIQSTFSLFISSIQNIKNELSLLIVAVVVSLLPFALQLNPQALFGVLAFLSRLFLTPFSNHQTS